MPLHEYKCGNNHRHEELVHDPDVAVPREIRCPRPGCQETSRRQFPRIRQIGPRTTDLENYEFALLTPQEREAGVRIRGLQDLRHIETARGIRQVDAGSPDAKESREYMEDTHHTRERIRSEDGEPGVDRYDLKEEVEAHGTPNGRLTNAEFNRYADAADRVMQKFQENPDAWLTDGTPSGGSGPPIDVRGPDPGGDGAGDAAPVLDG